ncbi:hypothetical protein D3C86_1261540 [compost metagenome]
MSIRAEREVLTSSASARISASRSALISRVVSAVGTRCRLTTREVESSASRLTAVTPSAAARSGVMRGLHVTTSMPRALPTRATRLPISPSPIRPSRSPCSTPGSGSASAGRQPPRRIVAICISSWRVAARISAHVISQVLSLDGPHSVLATGMPRARSASTSSVVLRVPVKTT